MADPREKISAYHDMPYAIFHYDPEQELPLRREVSSLQTRLENKGKRITRISLAECLDVALRSEATLEEWFENERTFGAEKAIEDVHKLLADRVPLVDLVAGRMPKTPIRERTSSSSSGPGRCSLSTGRSRCWSSSRDASSCRRCSSIRATSTARRGSNSWASSRPSTTIARRSSEEFVPCRRSPRCSPTTSPGRSRRSSRSTRPPRTSSPPKSTSTSSPTPSSGTRGGVRAVPGDATEAARRHRRLGVRLLRLGQVVVREGARTDDRESNRPWRAGLRPVPEAYARCEALR